MSWQDPQHPRDATRSVASVIGIVIAIVFAVGGLAVIGAYVLLIIGMSNYGSNK